MKAILIDVKSEQIRYVQVTKDSEGSTLKSMYDLIGCDLVQPIGIDDQNDIFIDEEGLLTLDENSKFFTFDGFPHPLAGNGLILGIDHEEGDTIDTNLTIEEIAKKVLFTDIHTLRLVYS